ncbi:MAG: hypothetical protein K2L97_05345 [Muribaculaceae bacterium]|nr:hypothetical protein [Muribaculaceae bacterium]
MIEFGRHNLGKFQSMNMHRDGVPSEPTLYRVENGIDSMELAWQMTEFAKRIVYSLFSVWKGRRKKLSDKA